ncbi:hypothetical protein PFL02_57820 [Pseudomonas fluorescens]|nr:hypothetical protein PPC_5467 [Pseudomonas protegens Cab57]GED78932.1 hypothetical protein PFL02_57820 [Pseudomonas fluorescens]
MQAAENRSAVGDIAQAEHHMLAAGSFIEKTMHGELRKRRRQLASSNKNDGHCCAPDLYEDWRFAEAAL